MNIRTSLETVESLAFAALATLFLAASAILVYPVAAGAHESVTIVALT